MVAAAPPDEIGEGWGMSCASRLAHHVLDGHSKGAKGGVFSDPRESTAYDWQQADKSA